LNIHPFSLISSSSYTILRENVLANPICGTRCLNSTFNSVHTTPDFVIFLHDKQSETADVQGVNRLPKSRFYSW